ncbi:DUF3466 family protein [Desulfuromonas sp. KJ2020]|uniref:DUF3466 family protein n=1 Tax=Desulfuromonas sp. KJ2020 TaxID=2919173 RepID=UPI0020A80C0D|nr:DUF3466 family protein [Desulfuromonas sp. KJ2020]MCP3176716.1 DUF3466 family protein [Desulfuromonas sp. KJ2020]
MKRILAFYIALFVAMLLVLGGCGGSNDGTDSGTIDTGTDTVPDSGSGTIIDVPTISAPVGELGDLTDTGDLLGSAGDNWYYTKTIAINDAGQIVGQSNAGIPVKAAFLWDPVGGMTLIPMHLGYFDDYYGGAGQARFIYSEPVDINNSGVVIGHSTTGTGWPEESEKRGFVYYSATDTFVDLAPISWDSDADAWTLDKSYSEVVDINDKGEVILTVDDAEGTHAYYWDGITMVTPGAPVSGDVPGLFRLGGIIGQNSEAVAINEIDQVVVNSGGTAVFIDLAVGVIESLNHLPGQTSTVAVDINNTVTVPLDRGHVVGNSGNKAFFWDGGAMKVVGDLGGGFSEAIDLNDRDQLVGNSKTSSGATHAFLWALNAEKEGVMRDLGTLGGSNSYATGINDAGQIVGYSETGEVHPETGEQIIHAFLWDDGVMYDLGTHSDFYDYAFLFPYPFSEAVAINTHGQVAGNSNTINAHYRGFYLNPTFP